MGDFIPGSIKLEGSCYMPAGGNHIMFSELEEVGQDMSYDPESQAQGDWLVYSAYAEVGGTIYPLPEGIFNAVNEDNDQETGCRIARLILDRQAYEGLYLSLYKDNVTKWCQSGVAADFTISWPDGSDHVQVFPPDEVDSAR